MAADALGPKVPDFPRSEPGGDHVACRGRAEVEPGASTTVTFTVPVRLLAYTGISGDVIMDPGPVELSAASSSDDIRATATFAVTGDPRVIRGEERAFLSTVGVTG